jgi:hypothetical protein
MYGQILDYAIEFHSIGKDVGAMDILKSVVDPQAPTNPLFISNCIDNVHVLDSDCSWSIGRICVTYQIHLQSMTLPECGLIWISTSAGKVITGQDHRI